MLWEDEAKQYGADIHRIQVWDAISEFFLDSYFDGNRLEDIAQRLAASPFSLDELRHIECFEVIPVCWSNIATPLPGEWLGFSPDWLIPNCLKLQKRRPFKPESELPLFARILLTVTFSNLPITRIATIRANANRDDATQKPGVFYNRLPEELVTEDVQVTPFMVFQFILRWVLPCAIIILSICFMVHCYNETHASQKYLPDTRLRWQS